MTLTKRKGKMRKVRVSFDLFIDGTEYSHPDEWNFNDIFGFRGGVMDCGASILNVKIEDLGLLADIVKQRTSCQS